MASENLFDIVGFVISYENGSLDHNGVVAGFQHIINTGIVFSLQGHYGRMASRLIESGECTLPPQAPRGE